MLPLLNEDSQGVSSAVEDNTQHAVSDNDGGGNCDTPGVFITWDFTDALWHAKFNNGPLSGQSLTSKVVNLTKEKWDKLEGD